MSQVSALDLWGHKRWPEDFCQHFKELWAVKSRSVKSACFVQTQLVSLFFVSSPCCSPAAFLNQFLGALGMCSGFRDFSRRVNFKKNCLPEQHRVPPHHTPNPSPGESSCPLTQNGFPAKFSLRKGLRCFHLLCWKYLPYSTCFGLTLLLLRFFCALILQNWGTLDLGPMHSS